LDGGDRLSSALLVSIPEIEDRIIATTKPALFYRLVSNFAGLGCQNKISQLILLVGGFWFQPGLEGIWAGHYSSINPLALW
jgi:hypothetical protein